MDVFFVESRLAGAGGGRAVRFGVATQRFLGAAGAASGVGQFSAPERLPRCARRTAADGRGGCVSESVG